MGGPSKKSYLHTGVPDDQNRRRSARVDVNLSVRVTSGEETSHTVAADISEGGMFIHELLPFEPGTQLELSFTLPGTDRPVECLAEVVRSRADVDRSVKRPLGNGLRFIKIQPRDAVAIVEYLRARQR